MNTQLQWDQQAKIDPMIASFYEFLKPGDEADAFEHELEFGTAGMRGLIGPGANRLNDYTIRKACWGFASYLLETQPEVKTKGVAIAFDNRHFSQRFAQLCAEVLASLDIPSSLFSSLRPTPELSYAVRTLGCSGGIMITASHNPREYNGFKVYDETGCQLTPDKIAKVLPYIAKWPHELDLIISVSAAQQSLIKVIDTVVDDAYLSDLRKIHFRAHDPKAIKVVFTPQHGTAYPILVNLLTGQGYEIHCVEDQCTPDPDFSHTLSPNPEEHKAYDEAIALAKTIDADLVLSTDPDADRMGIVVKQGDEYVYLTGNQGGSILQEFIYSALRDENRMPEHPVMFNTIVTSDLGQLIAEHYGVDNEKTLTGFKYIGSKIAQYDQTKAKNFVFGYEESYGYLIQPIVRDKDALQACLVLCEAACYYKQHGKTLVDVLNQLYATYGTYYETQTSVSYSGASGAEKIQAILSAFRNTPLQSLAGIKVIGAEDYLSGKHTGEATWTLDLPRENVLKYFLEDGSWVAIRPSGTEPKCKFYFCVKGRDEAEAQAKFNALSTSVTQVY